MSWYKDHREIWKQIIETVAAEEHRTTQMVEKDTIQSMFLLGLSKGDIPFVFKGGTSLSKVYGLIDRFSEDIDLSLNRKPTEAEKRKTKIIVTGIADELGLVLSNPEAVQSSRSLLMHLSSECRCSLWSEPLLTRSLPYVIIGSRICRTGIQGTCMILLNFFPM